MKSVLYGTYAGLATIAYFFIFYSVSPETMLHWGVNLSSFIFYIAAMYLAVWKSGQADFRLALREAFTVFIVANALYSLFYYFMFKYFDPKLVDLQYEMMRSSGWTEGKIKREDVTITPGGAFFNYSFSLIGGFILSVIVVWVVNRRRQMYHNQ
ncbi:MAG: DUF4199 domain-containing protein [Saprospiraceae bacterium]|nr:DUF4199 domain-containing protein [Saprospiraceae bacterium]